MKHFFIAISFLLCLIPFDSKAEINDDSKIEELSLQIDSLTHQVDFLKMSYNAYVMNNDLKILALEVNSRINDMKMNLYHNSCSIELYKMYSRLYDSFKSNLESTKELIESQQGLFIAMLLYREWPTNELDTLNQAYGMTKGLYERAEIILDMMKDLLGLYRQTL